MERRQADAAARGGDGLRESAETERAARWASALNRSGRSACQRSGARGELPTSTQLTGHIGALRAHAIDREFGWDRQESDQEKRGLADEFRDRRGFNGRIFQRVAGIGVGLSAVVVRCGRRVTMAVTIVVVVAHKGDFESGGLEGAVQSRGQPKGQERDGNEAAEERHGGKRAGESAACQGTRQREDPRAHGWWRVKEREG